MTTRIDTRFGAFGATLIMLVAAVTLIALTATADQGDTTRVSVNNNGNQGNNGSDTPAISANGRYVTFDSDASNLVANDTNGLVDVFVRDRNTGNTTRVSVDSNGNQGDNISFNPSISADGRYVTFHSLATNLVGNDTNGFFDVFVHDRETSETTRVSLHSSGTQANGNSLFPVISANGRYVAFHSFATNLVPGDTNDSGDVFVHDRETSETARVSLQSDGTEGDNNSSVPSISANGRYVAFDSDATNLVPGDTNDVSDVFVHDRETRETFRVSLHSNGNQGNHASFSSSMSISANGRYVAFDSHASTLVTTDTNNWRDVFVHDTQTRETTRVSLIHTPGAFIQGDDNSSVPSISTNGRYVAFHSDATNLVPGDTNNAPDVFVHDTNTGENTRVSVRSNGNQGNDGSSYSDISADGRFVAFGSEATNLVANDTNGFEDVFVHQYLPDPPPPTTPTTTTTLPPGNTDFFTDDDGHLFEDDINAIAEAGITRGCNPPDNDHYCPDESFLRGQAAAFLRRALDVPASDTDHFTDDDNSVFEEDINAIATEGITLGCNPPDNTLFCPEDPFTRGQAAAFVRRALDVPASDTDHFVDDDSSIFEADINAIAEAGITRGCNPPDNTRYCPDDLLTRGQAAAFMRRALLP